MLRMIGKALARYKVLEIFTQINTKRSIYEFFGNPLYSKPALNNLDEKLSHYLNFRKGFFIEIGANDGFSQSNTYYLEKLLGWSGVLVEPIPDLYRKCRELRKNSYVYHGACVSSNNKDTQINIRYAGLMSIIENSLENSSLENNHIQKWLNLQNNRKSYTISVPAITLESILDNLPDKPEKIDFFSLDVEGYELSVLKGLNLKKYQPIYILVENKFSNEELHEYLSEFYDLVGKLSQHDYLFQLRNF
jgi:FkbM family methyltransferase